MSDPSRPTTITGTPDPEDGEPLENSFLPAPQINAPAPIPLEGDVLTQEAIQAAEKRVEMVKKIRRIVLSVTTPGDWTDVSGEPYLGSTGTQKIARLFGISMKMKGPVQIRHCEDEDGKEFEQYIATCIGSMRGGEVETEGIAATNDPFLSDIGSIRKKAVTNAQTRAVKQLLGLGKFTWDEIPAAREEIKGYQHKSGAKGGKARSGGWQDEPIPEGIDVRKETRRMLEEMSHGDKAKRHKLWTALAGFQGRDGKQVPPPATPDLLSDRAAPVVYGKVRKAYKEWMAGQPAAPGAEEDAF